MRKHYGNHYRSSASRVSPYTVNCDMDDIDERLDRLEKLVRAHVLEPAGVPPGSAMTTACDKVEKAAKQVRALADAITKPKDKRQDIMGMALTKAGLREQVAELRSANHTLAQQVSSLSKLLADAQDAYWKVKIEATNEKIERDNKLRQFVKETTGRA